MNSPYIELTPDIALCFFIIFVCLLAGIGILQNFLITHKRTKNMHAQMDTKPVRAAFRQLVEGMERIRDHIDAVGAVEGNISVDDARRIVDRLNVFHSFKAGEIDSESFSAFFPDRLQSCSLEELVLADALMKKLNPGLIKYGELHVAQTYIDLKKSDFLGWTQDHDTVQEEPKVISTEPNTYVSLCPKEQTR